MPIAEDFSAAAQIAVTSTHLLAFMAGMVALAVIVAIIGSRRRLWVVFTATPSGLKLNKISSVEPCLSPVSTEFSTLADSYTVIIETKTLVPEAAIIAATPRAISIQRAIFSATN